MIKKLLVIGLFILNVPVYSQSAGSTDSEIQAVADEPVALSTEAAPALTVVKEVKWPALDTLLAATSDTTYVVNFWATWCRPCVVELPYFEELNRRYASQKVRVILVSMDFVKDIEDRVIPFVERMKLTNTVWLLNEPDANSWIEKVDPSWTGALPATLIFNPVRTKRTFYEKALDYETLARELSYFIEY